MITYLRTSIDSASHSQLPATWRHFECLVASSFLFFEVEKPSEYRAAHCCQSDWGEHAAPLQDMGSKPITTQSTLAELDTRAIFGSNWIQ
jgi:hypothetical protein